jgi:hypothetical protein
MDSSISKTFECKLKMKFSKLSILYIFFFFSCDLKMEKMEKSLTSFELDYIILGDSIVTKKNDSYPQLSYKFNIDTIDNNLKSIFCYSDLKKVQVILVNKFIDKFKFQFIDWNFDGYNDLTVLSNCGSGGCAYLIWNYSIKNRKYYFNEELSEVLGLEIDTVSKYIVFHNRAGYNLENWDSFKYVNNKLTLVKRFCEEKRTDSVGHSWVKITRKEIINNKSIISSDSFIVK